MPSNDDDDYVTIEIVKLMIMTMMMNAQLDFFYESHHQKAFKIDPLKIKCS